MTGTTHQMVALVSALWLLTLFPVSLGPILGIIALVAVMIGALTPDLDQPTANLFQRIIGGKMVHRLFSAFSGGHRHFTHSVLGIICITYILHWIIFHIIQIAFHPQAFIILIAFLIGYISHPITDTLTDQGVPWLWPLPWNLKLPPGPNELRVTTGSFVEIILVRGGLLVVACLLLSNHWQVLVHLFQ